MNETEQQAEPRDEREVKSESAPLPMIQVRGEGYVTRKDGTVVPFTLKGEG